MLNDCPDAYKTFFFWSLKHIKLIFSFLFLGGKLLCKRSLRALAKKLAQLNLFFLFFFWGASFFASVLSEED
jgi:hypothetical protein